MKKVIVFGLVGIMVLGMAVAASAAYDPDWQIAIKVASDSAQATRVTTEYYGTKATAINGFGGEDLVGPPAGSAEMLYIYSTVDSKSCLNDFRGSFDGTTQTWTLAVAGQNTTNYNGKFWLWAWNPVNKTTIPKDLTKDFAPADGQTIELYSNFNNVRTLLWTVNGDVNGTGNVGDANTYNFANGFDWGTTFELVQSVPTVPDLPEPGSVVAMLSGLVGLAGFGIRRRK